MHAEPTVFVVDDDAAVRDSLRVLFESVGIPNQGFASAEQFLAQFDAERPGCLILDVRMPGSGGLALQQALAARGSVLPIIFMTGYAEVPIAVAAMKAGAADFIEKPCSHDLLLTRIRQAIATDAAARADRARRSQASERIGRLSKREMDVLHLLLAGKRTREIAARLFRAEKTVEFHRANIMRKLGVATVAQLAQLAADAQLPPPGPLPTGPARPVEMN